MTTGPRQHPHQRYTRIEISGQTFCSHLDIKPGTKLLFLGGDANRAVVGVAYPCCYATHRLHSGYRHSDHNCSQRHSLEEILGDAKATGK